ncbi:Glycerophosphocholine acyltransferase [Paramyrothecium foliicola]|nr:Glycerophosphocholine acyltransferase [Paramyrothecium foliicola]
MDDDPKAEPIPTMRSKSDPVLGDGDLMGPPELDPSSSPLSSSPLDHTILDTPTLSATEPKLSRNPSFSGSTSSQMDDWDFLPPLDRLSVLDLLDNFALPQQLEKLQKGFSAQTDKVRRSRDAFKSKTQVARERMVEEWRRRVPSADERFDRYRRRMRQRVEKLGKQWNNTKAVSLREKISFICGVMNIFISGYLIGGFPEYFHLWYTAQLVYFMPIRIFTYHRRGMHYFLVDLCYFVNLLLSLSIWVFPKSKRLFTAAYCLAYGNNAVAIIMWRNSLVFHSFDKVTSLFIHIMPCATLHCIVHLLPHDLQMTRFPAIWTIKTSPPGSPTAYANVFSMLAWSSIPYAIWQLSYYFFITVRRREKIAAGRPTSFTWLRRSYAKTWIGRFVLSLPVPLQEPAFMMIQYCYAVTTMLPCSLWFYSRYASSAFLVIVFAWSIWNGSTYYIDVFGKRFQKELEAMRVEVMRWQKDPELMLQSPLITPHPDNPAAPTSSLQVPGLDSSTGQEGQQKPGMGRTSSLDRIPLLDDQTATATALDESSKDIARERKVGQDFEK